MIKMGMIILLSIVAVSCSAPLINMNTSGEMDLTLDRETMRSVISDLDTIPAYYRIEGSNDRGSVFDIETADTNILMTDIKFGIWQIRVRAYNILNLMIAEGTGTLELRPGGYANMTIVLYETTGTGSLNFFLNWNADLVYYETLKVNLKTLGGDIFPLIYNQNAGSASGLTENISAGFYILEVQLFDNLELVMGAVELILIREAGVTDINLDFTQINKPGQRFPIETESFTITWDYSDITADKYKIYFREHGSYNWTYLGSTLSGSIQEFTVDHSILSNGIYDFAVSTIIGAEESELHTSMDDSALPATGWYIDWQG